MKCENCPALRTEGYEYPETYCCVYGEDEGLNNDLLRCEMGDEIPSFLQDFVFRFQQALGYQGYDIVKREDKSNE